MLNSTPPNALHIAGLVSIAVMLGFIVCGIPWPYAVFGVGLSTVTFILGYFVK